MAQRQLKHCRRSLDELGGRTPLRRILDALEVLGWEAASYSEDGEPQGMIIGTARYVEDMTEAMALAFGGPTEDEEDGEAKE